MKKFSVLILLLAAATLPAWTQYTENRRETENRRLNRELITDRLTLTQQGGPQVLTWHTDNANGRFRIFSQPNVNTAGTEYLTITGNGFVGIGLERPAVPLHLSADNLYMRDRPGQFMISGRSNPNLKMFMGVRTDLQVPVAEIAFVEEGVAWRNISLGPNGSNVGIGILTPREKLEVLGNIRSFGAIMAHSAVFDSGGFTERDRYYDRRPEWDRERERDRGYRTEDVILGIGARHERVFRVDDQGSVYAAKGFFPGGVDYAESVDVTGDRAGYQPGDVMAIDETAANGFTLTRQVYSTLVAGVYSTKPGVLASTHPLEVEKFESEIPLAMFGIVPCKVSAENGPIQRGDLLVSASKPGYAMKGTDKKRMLGAIIGKALDPLPEGTGTIRVMLSSR